MGSKRHRAIVIRDLTTNAAVHQIEVSNPTERKLEKLERGLLLKTDLDRFWVDLSEFDDDTPDHLAGFDPYGEADR